MTTEVHTQSTLVENKLLTARIMKICSEFYPIVTPDQISISLFSVIKAFEAIDSQE